MSALGKIAGIGGGILSIAGAPFTGGGSLAWLPAALGAASGVDAAFGGSGGGGKPNPMGDLSKYSSMLGDSGKSMLDSGSSEVSKSRDLFNPITQRNSRLMSGDMNQINDELRPEMDAIGQQFANVRNMISDQPRGGGKTSTLAQLPIEQIKLMANLVSNERSKAADTQSGVAGRLLSSGESERDTGLQSIGNAGNLALGQESAGLQRRGQNIGIADKISETVAELGFLLKGGPKKNTSPYPQWPATPPFNAGSRDVSSLPDFGALLKGIV